MRTRTRWIVAGGAAAFVLTPVAAVVGSTALDGDLGQGLVVETQVANRGPSSTARPGTGQPSDRPVPDPSGKKTVSAVSPVSPRTASDVARADRPGEAAGVITSQRPTSSSATSPVSAG